MPTSLVVSRPVCHELTSPAKLLRGREDGKATSADGAWHRGVQSSADASRHVPGARGGWRAWWPPPRSLGQGHRGRPAGRVPSISVPGTASAATAVMKLRNELLDWGQHPPTVGSHWRLPAQKCWEMNGRRDLSCTLLTGKTCFSCFPAACLLLLKKGISCRDLSTTRCGLDSTKYETYASFQRLMYQSPDCTLSQGFRN